MTRKFAFLIISFLEGLASLFFLFILPGNTNSAWFLGMSPARLMMVGAIFVVELGLGWAVFHFVRKDAYGEKIENGLDHLLDSSILSSLLLILLIAGSALGGFFTVSWWAIGERYLAFFERLAPLIYFETAVCLQFLFLFRARFRNFAQGYALIEADATKGKQTFRLFIEKYKLKPLGFIALVAIFSWTYFSLATYHATVQNIDKTENDQNAYLDFAREASASGFRYLGDRNRMPLYPFIQAVFLDPNKNAKQQFMDGKQVNIVLSLVLLLLLLGVISRFLTPGLMVNFILIAAFALYIFKAGYFQAELLFYFLSLMSFILMGWLLIAPSYRLGIATGAMTAFAQLTKASMLPMLALFSGFYALKVVFKSRQIARDEPSKRPPNWGQIRYLTGILLCVVLVFLGMLYPYLRESKQLFGQCFYNVNSNFYMWYDSWDEVKLGTRAHGDRIGWPQMPSEELPSFQKYIREHSLAQIKTRMLDGLANQYVKLSKPYAHFNYLAIYATLLLVSSLIGIQKTFPLLKKNILLVGFVLAYFVVYLLLFSWWTAISGGYRFTLSLFLPILFTTMFALQSEFTQFGLIHFKGYSLKASTLLGIFNWAILILILIDIVQFIPLKLGNYYFGN